MKLSVIIPVHNGSHDLRLCMEALAASTRPPDEIWVVDDASTDDSAEVARSLGARVLSLPDGPHGPGVARNRGAKAASGDVIVFFDADVVVHQDTTKLIAKYFEEEPQLAALFGSYDASPPARGAVTLYKNLLHHYVHQHSRREASTFWTGCGAVRREVFLAVGGFDAKYGRPSIEDIELGRRLKRDGHRIWLCPDVQVTHLKRWTLKSMLLTDIFCRAVPWTQLLLREEKGLPNDLNLDFKSRLSAVAAWLSVIFLVLGFWKPAFWLGAVAGSGTVAACNADLLHFFRRRGGAGFALRAFGLHTLYFLYSSLTFGLLTIRHKLSKRTLTLLLLATLFKGLAWSLIIPPWQASDEPQQFLYAQSVERSHSGRIERQVTLPQEVWLLADAVQFDRIVHQNEHSINFSNRAQVSRIVAAADSSAARRVLVRDENKRLLKQRDFTLYHPPLFFALTGAVQAPLEGNSIRVRLLASRWVSLALGLVTTVLAFSVGRTLWPRRPSLAMLLAILVSFQPMVTFTFSTVSNIALEIALFSACLLIALRVMRDGLTLSHALMLGGLTALGLLTKVSFICLLPLLGLLMIHGAVTTRRRARSNGFAASMWPWLLVAVLPLVMCGWWYRSALGDVSGAGSGGGSGSHAARIAVAGAAGDVLSSQNLIGKYGRVLISYWGNFGWPDTIMPLWILALLGLMTTLAVASTTYWLFVSLRSRRQPSSAQDEPFFAFLFLGCATLMIAAFYLYMNYRIASFGIRGQYYLAAIVGQMVWLLWGLGLLFPQGLRSFGMWLLGAAMIVLNGYSLFIVILPRYYGAAGFGTLLERVTLLQPINFPMLITICMLFLASSLLLVMVLSGAFLGESDQHDEAMLSGVAAAT